ncbi:MAG: RagB/SusD family nutrient uptake outer membrane protein [Prevotella sp.]|nr:RagB/SusD family nutrient uptake outer membrane protein [Prevotella sp.]
MKHYIFPIATVALACLLGFTSCSDVLDRPSKTTEEDDNYWNNEDKVRLYANDFYDYFFPGYGTGWTVYYAPGINNTSFSDDVLSNSSQSNFTRQVPLAKGSTSTSTSNYQSEYQGPSWDFAYIRKINIMKDRLEQRMKGVLSTEAYNHWMGFARLFHGIEYARLVNVFGDVPYYNHEITNLDRDEVYKDRTPRNEVMDSVYEDFTYALNNIRKSDGSGTVNRYIAAALVCRYALYEGSWQKYYYGNNERAKKFFELSKSAGDMVINSGKYAIVTPFRDLFCSTDLSSAKDVLLYRKYDSSLGKTHCIASYCNVNESMAVGPTADLIKSFICVDGKDYQESKVTSATDFRLEKLIQTRDPRFEATFYDSLTTNARASMLYVVKFIPRSALSYLSQAGGAPANEWTGTNNTTGYPVIRYAEVLLNWIEAKAELETLGGPAVTQEDIDISINAIRDRPLDAGQAALGVKKTAHMQLDDLPDDPDRDSDVPKLLWEIRRERRMEFAFEQGRIIDLRRWHKLNYMDTTENPDLLYGAYVDMSRSGKNSLLGDLKKYVGKMRVLNSKNEYVVYNGSNHRQIRGWFQAETTEPRQQFLNMTNVNPYLCPIGTNQINDYKIQGYTLTQTEGWPSTNN